MNYLGLVGVLGLTGEADGPPIQAAGQIADLGGGALMAAFGILAALRERERSGEGQFVDISMADGALSWLAMVAARHLAEGNAPRRGDLELAGAYVCYRPYACKDGWVTLGALEPKFWQAWCRGRGPGGPDREPVRPARLRRPRRGGAGLPRAHARTSGSSSPPSTTAAWSRCWSWTRRWSPSSCARARWWWRSISRAPRGRCGCWATR